MAANTIQFGIRAVVPYDACLEGWAQFAKTSMPSTEYNLRAWFKIAQLLGPDWVHSVQTAEIERGSPFPKDLTTARLLGPSIFFCVPFAAVGDSGPVGLCGIRAKSRIRVMHVVPRVPFTKH